VKAYQGAYDFFDATRGRTLPLRDRPNKVTRDDLVDPRAVHAPHGLEADEALDAVAAAVHDAHRRGRPVLWFMGAHPVKLGLSGLVIGLMERGVLTHVAGTGAVAIHDFELALIGETSENVPNALPEGRFGMADETGRLLNGAVRAGYDRGLGFGEAVGRLILGEPMPEPADVRYPDLSVLAAGVRLGVPVTIHVGIGTDIIDQHPSFDGAAKGGASGLDFGVYVATVAKLTQGGVVLNVGSAVTGPEVLLKAVSMAANAGQAPGPIATANFDLRPVVPGDAADEDKPTYYFRDNKSVVTRIPAAFGGTGHYVCGHFRDTLPALYARLTEEI
jgi:hypothetical protein